MSNIDAQIKALQLKKKKIDYVSYIADLVKNDTKCIDFKDVKDEVVTKIEPFLLKLMTAIETDSDVPDEDSNPQFSDKEREALKIVAQKVLNKGVEPQTPVSNNQPYSKEQTPPAPKKPEKVMDKMSFALDNRHLANKQVQVINDKNVKITGTVVGLDAPFVIVKTDSGPTIQVPLEKVVTI